MKITYEVHISDDFDAYTNSRLALKQLLINQGHVVNDLKADLVLIDFQNLPKYPGYLTSVSHTKGAGASVLAPKKDHLALGVDIEWRERILKEGTQKFFRHPEDSYYENDLELWTMKEAAFKALSPLGFPGVLVLSKIIIQEGIFWTKENPDLKGKVETFNKTSLDKNLVISIASVSRF